MAHFHRTEKTKASVPTSSMADIAFLLLIFFMVTTIFKLEEGLPVTLPRAEAGQSMPRNQILHIWVMGDRITIMDNRITVADIVPYLVDYISNEPTGIVGLNIDQSVPWDIASEVIEAMKEALALNASFTIDVEKKR